MKLAAAILGFFCLSALSSQTGPPTLRCLEVQANGNVLLHWTPPADPLNQFSHYEVWFSIDKQLPFSLVTPTVAPISVQSLLHNAVDAGSQVFYYYMRSVSTDGSSSISSDTLRTIFLNIVPKSPALHLTFGSTGGDVSKTFTITKEWPIGNVNNLTVTPLNEHFDEISVCDAFINYQVLLQHASGCVSKSNTIKGLYFDTKDPDTTYVDSISVLPDGRTILAWTEAADLDVDSYWVIRKLPPDISKIEIDSMAGRQTTSYIYNSTDANDRPVQLFVVAQDSCANRRGNFDERPITMHLVASYNHCAYRSQISWNAYRGMKKGIKEYRVYYSVEGGDFVRLGTTNDTVYIHEDVEPEKKICYFVRVVNGDESITASSNRTCLFTTQVSIPSLFYMSAASVNEEQNVDVRIYVDPEVAFASMDIQRADDTLAGYSTVGTLPGNGTTLYAFTDENARTAERAYWYRAVLMDSCGNARARSNLCRTILLHITGEDEQVFERTLSWNEYAGFAGGVRGYHVYRVLNDGSPHEIAFLPANFTTYTDNLEDAANEGARVAYFIQAEESAGSATGIIDHSNSNRREVYQEGRIFVPNGFAPAGVNKTWRPVTHFVQKTEYLVRVFNRWGHEVFVARDDRAEWDGGNCEQGVYIYLISYINARGEYREQKGTVMLVR